MKQNIYDNQTFFDGYKKLRETESGLNAVLEIPAIRSLMPDLTGKRIIDLGCGFGDFCRYAISSGARHVTGVEISEKMLSEARDKTDDSRIEYVHLPIEDYRAEPDSVDLVTSSLVFQYIRDYDLVVRNIYKWLKNKGQFIFSNEHPICTASGGRAWQKDKDGNKLHWKVDNYMDEGIRKTTWFIENRIIYHRTLETLLNTLIDIGFTIKRVAEPEALSEYVKERPDLLDEHRRPPFIIIVCEK